MKHQSLFSTLLALTLMGTGLACAGEESHAMQMPQPTVQHQWLQQMVGQWESKTEAYGEPGQAPSISAGTENITAVGPFWTVNEVKGTMMEHPFTGHFTLGYDAQKQKYQATWVDSMTGRLWQYEGAVDPSGKILTLETEGTCPMMSPGKTTRFREVIELQDADHKVFTSSMLAEDGQWVTMMVSRAQRIK